MGIGDWAKGYSVVLHAALENDGLGASLSKVRPSGAGAGGARVSVSTDKDEFE